MNKDHHILILGIDGYIGHALAHNLLDQGYTVSGLDNFSRRQRVADLGSNSITPIPERISRLQLLSSYPTFKSYHMHTLTDYVKIFQDQPDTIIHLAEQPSAPWSMQSEFHAMTTQSQNVLGTLHLLWQMKEHCPDAHLIKLGTMGEYGKPNCAIPEGKIPKHCIDNKTIDGTKIDENIENICPLGGLPFPKQPNSFYHLTKVHDTNNIIFACKTWGLSCTDIMQGVVYGLTDTASHLLTRFDYDECFGTCINRFCAQAISNNPLTIYGSGRQSYSFLPLRDSLQCINLVIKKPPKKAEYRTLNQFEGVYSVSLLANLICRTARELSPTLTPTAIHISNPRTEPEDHIYEPVNDRLIDLGYKPSHDIEGEIKELLKTLLPYASRVKKKVLVPKINWV